MQLPLIVGLRTAKAWPKAKTMAKRRRILQRNPLGG